MTDWRSKPRQHYKSLDALARRKLAGEKRELRPIRALPRGSCGSCGEIRDDRIADPDQNNVPVCGTCRTEPASVRVGPERGYEPSGGLPTQAEAKRAELLMYGRERVARNKRAARVVPLSRGPRTPGWLVVNVPIRDETGRNRDQRDAWQTLRNEPWFKDMRYIGCDQRFFVWERPPTIELKNDYDALGALQRMAK